MDDAEAIDCYPASGMLMWLEQLLLRRQRRVPRLPVKDDLHVEELRHPPPQMESGPRGEPS
jgi:hypothetical protein